LGSNRVCRGRSPLALRIEYLSLPQANPDLLPHSQLLNNTQPNNRIHTPFNNIHQTKREHNEKSIFFSKASQAKGITKGALCKKVWIIVYKTRLKLEIILIINL
jgi:hypothetical protein